MTKQQTITIAACAALAVGVAAHAQVTLNSVRVGVKDTVSLAIDPAGNRLELIQRR